jgi:hypothetical protein
MDFLLFLLEHHAAIIVLFFASLAAMFVVIRPLLRFMVDSHHRHKIATGHGPGPVEGWGMN